MHCLSLLLALPLASAFLPPTLPSVSTSLNGLIDPMYVEVGNQKWDPLDLALLGQNIDTFPNMFPDQQFVEAAEIKHGRMAMLAWTGVWATEGLGLRFPAWDLTDKITDWTVALPIFLREEPAMFAAIMCFIAVAEGESVGHSGDNYRGKSTKDSPGDLGLYLWGGNPRTMKPEKLETYMIQEKKHGRLAMIGMASLMAWKVIPGSVPIMDALVGK